MRIFHTAVEAINEVTRDLFARGVEIFDPTVQGVQVEKKDYDSKELIGYTYKILSHDNIEAMLDWAATTFSKPNGLKEAQTWLSNRLAGRWMNQPSSKYREDYWKSYRESDGLFAYTYEERMIYLPRIIHALKQNKYMRGAVMTIYETTRDQTNMGKRRVPCSMYYHFLVRPRGKYDVLTLMYTMRSCDLVNHFAQDVYMAMKLQEYVASQIGVKVGDFIHFIGSLHAYKKDVPEDRKW